jgi:hypothetical protein
MGEFDVIGVLLKVTGEAVLPAGTELEHGDELFVMCRVTIREIAFPETKEGSVIRVHKARADEAFVIEAEAADKVIAAERERLTGQGSLIAEIDRVQKAAEELDTAGLL